MLILEKIKRRITETIEPLIVPCWMFYLRLRNRYWSGRVVSAGGPVVSLTTHGKRLNAVFYTIETIAHGFKLPAQLILWIDDASAFSDLPPSLRRLQSRGLDVRLTENWGPHTKYFPYIRGLPQDSPPVVTADDDILYPPYWLSGLRAAYKGDSTVINCYRAHVVGLDGIAIRSYSTWKPCESMAASFAHFATGVSGVIYPPAFLRLLRDAGPRFVDLCPKADDIWLHVMAMRGGYRIKQIFQLPRHFYHIPGTQDIGLVQSNSFASGNDCQIASTYVAEDLRMMLAESQAGQEGSRCRR